MIVDFETELDVDEAAERAARVFGIAYIGVGQPGRARSMDAIADGRARAHAGRALRVLRGAGAAHALDVRDMSPARSTIAVGQRIKDATGARVDLSNPEATVWIELFAGSRHRLQRSACKGPGVCRSGSRDGCWRCCRAGSTPRSRRGG